MSLKAQARRRMALVVGSFLFLVLLIGGGLLFRHLRTERRYAELRAGGMAAAAAGDDAKVVSDLGRYLIHTPGDIEALAAYAHSRPKVHMPTGSELMDTRRALRNLLQLDPERIPERRELMELYYYYFRMLTEADDEATALLLRVPNDAEAMDIRIGAEEGLHQYADALKDANNRLLVDPQDWEAQIDRLQILSQLGRPSEVIIKTANDAIQGHEGTQGALVVKAYASRLANDLPTAQVALHAASTQPCTAKTVGFALMQMLDGMGMHTDAMNVLKQLGATNDPQMRKLWMFRLWEDSRFADLVAFYNSPAAPDLNDSRSMGMYADALHWLGRDAQAAPVLKELTARSNADLQAAAWLAIELAQLKPGGDQQLQLAARSACATAIDHNPNDQYLIYYQGVYEASTGEANVAIELWEKAASLDVSWQRPLLDQAQLLLSQGRLDQAEAAARRAFGRVPNSPAGAIVLSRVWFAQVESGSTKQIAPLTLLLGEIQKAVPGEEQTLAMQISLMARAGQTEQAADALRNMLNRQPPPTSATLLVLANISRQWKLGLEQECLDANNNKYGRTPQSALAEAMDDWKQHKGDQALQMLNVAVASAEAAEKAAEGTAEFSAKEEDVVRFRIALASYLESTADPGATDAWRALGDDPQYAKDLSLQRTILISKAAYADRAFFDRTINRVHDLTGDQNDSWKLARARWLLDGSSDARTAGTVITLLSDVLKDDPHSLEANMLMAEAKTRTGDVNGATEQMAAVERLDPNSTMTALDMARLLQYRGDFDSARQQLDLASREASATPEQRAQIASLMAHQGDVTQAIAVLEPLAADPRATEAVKVGLASLYCRNRQFDKAQAICNALLQTTQGQDTAPVLVLEAQIDMFNRRPDDAEKKLAGLDSLNLPPGQEPLMLAEFHGDFDEFDKAMVEYRAAAQAIPDNPNAWLGLIACQIQLGQKDQVAATLTEALNEIGKAMDQYRAATQATPDNASAWLGLINCQIQLGQKDQVAATLTNALSHCKDNAQLLAAQRELSVQGQEDADLLALQKQVNLIVNAGGGLSEKRALTSLLRDTSPDDPPAKTLRVIEATEYSDLSANQQLAQLQQLSQENPRFLPAQTALSEGQLRLGRCEEAAETANRAVSAFPSDAVPAEIATDALVATGRWPAALQMARNWRERIVGDPINIDLEIAQIQLRLGDADGAMATVQRFQNAPELTLQQTWQVDSVEAQVLVAQGKPDDAAQLLWAVAQKYPPLQPIWLNFVISGLPPAMAEPWLNRTATLLDSETGSEMAQLSLADAWHLLGLRTGNKQYTQNARDLAARLEQVPAVSASAACVAGMLAGESGDIPAAEAAYRRALAKAPIPDAQNNLAMLLVDHGGDMKEATDLIQQCVKNQPTANYYDTLGYILGQAKNYDQAVVAERMAMRMQPDNARWHVNLAKLLVASGKMDEAKSLLAELDLMTPGIQSLPDNYRHELDALRKQLNGPSVTSTH
jgi:tetratricopeptide (TPR) repeat protein